MAVSGAGAASRRAESARGLLCSRQAGNGQAFLPVRGGKADRPPTQPT